jgi:hypothetical protein
MSNLFGQWSAERRVRLGLALLICIGPLAPSAFGVSSCVTDTYANYELTGSCTIGQFTLQGFSFSNSSIPAQSTPGAPILLTASQIQVDPTGSGAGALSLRFTSLAGGGFSVAAGQFAEYIFRYQVDPPPPIIRGAQIDLGANDPVTLTGEYCGNGTLVSAPGAIPVTCTGTSPSGIFPGRVSITGPSAVTQSQSFTFPQPVSTVDTRLILDLEGRNTPSGSHVTFFASDTNLVVAVPEPSMLLLAPFGLLALWRARLRKRG